MPAVVVREQLPEPPTEPLRAPRAELLSDRLVAAMLGALVLALATLMVSHWPVGVFQDDGMYVILAKSLATGQGYRYLNLPGHPVGNHYPPGYPALLALLWRVMPSFPANVVLFKFANAVFLAATAVGGYWLARVRLGFGKATATLAVLAGTLAIPPLLLAGMLLSETFFLALLLPAFMLGEQIAERGGRGRAVTLGLLCGVLVLVRTLGIVIVPAVLLVLAARRRWTEAAIFSVVVVAMLLPWQLWISAQPSGLPPELEGKYGSYLGWLIKPFRERGASFAVAALKENIASLMAMFGTLLAVSSPAWFRAVIQVTFLVFLGLGSGRLVRRAPSIALFLAAYFAIVLLWPFSPLRFVWAMWLPLTLVIALGAAGAAQWRPTMPAHRYARVAALVLFVALCVSWSRYNVRGYRGQWWQTIQRTGALPILASVEWTEQHTGPRDVIASDYETAVYLYTGRESVPHGTFTAAEYIDAPTDADILRAMQAIFAFYPVTHALLATSPSQLAAATLAARTPPALVRLDSLRAVGVVYGRPPR